MSIEIANESGAQVDESRLLELAAHVLAETEIDPAAELSLLLVDVETMTELHQRWMDEPGPTDVLAFPMDELGDVRGPGMSASGVATLLGDVVLCPEVAAEQAKAAQHTVADELALLCTHGILHLLGYDHAEDDERQEMFGLQQRLLSGWRRPDDGRR